MNTFFSEDVFTPEKRFLDDFVSRDFDKEQDNTINSGRSFDQPLEQNYGDIAMTRGQARGILDRLTKEAVKGNITPAAFQRGLFELSTVGSSPDYSRRLIRNALKTPLVRLGIENPELAKQALNTFGSAISKEGFNPATGAKHFDAAQQLLEQAKKDNLLRPNVTIQETREEIQKPMYGALMDWTRSNLNNPQVQKVLARSGIGSNQQWGPRGFAPIAVGFEPERFGVKLTPAAQKVANEEIRREAWERSPAGQKELLRRRKEDESFRRQQEEIEKLLLQEGIKLSR